MTKKTRRVAPLKPAPMYGPARLLTRAEAEKIVRHYSSVERITAEEISKVVDRMTTHGECLIHAICEIKGTDCWAFCCKP